LNAPKTSDTRFSIRLAAGALALVVLAALGWFLFGREEAKAPRADVEQATLSEESEPHEAVASASLAERPVAEKPTAPVASTAPSAGDLPPSHPLTPAHERIYRENHLIGQLQGAIDVEDAAGIRKLLKQYREEYPEDEHLLQGGYERIADCLEHPGEATRAEAQRWYDDKQNRASTVRRAVRLICLEP
jgi:hypothetical protein